MDQPACLGCRALERRVAELEAHVERLTRLLDQQRRAGKRQAAPFAKGPPEGPPKKPGRKPGADYGPKAHRPPPTPEQIDEVHEAPLPDACPACGGALDETRVDQQYQVEIPRTPLHRQCNVHVGRCRDCQRRVQGRHPLQTSDALGAAASQLGPAAVERFRREVQAAAQLAHPNIVTAYDAEQAGATHFLVMDLFFGYPGLDGGDWDPSTEAFFQTY